MPDWRFIHTDNADCAKMMELNFPGIALFRLFDYDFLQLEIDSIEGSGAGVQEYEQILSARRLPELIYFSEEFITPVLNE